MKYKAYEDLAKLVPADEFNKRLLTGDVEIDMTMLCFEENYVPLANNLPKDLTIVDCGCYMAAQAYLFSDFANYIGVDSYDKSDHLSWYRPPERFTLPNVVHYSLNIEEYMQTDDFKSLDLDKTYFICSAVPSHEQTEKLFNAVKNCAVFYPGKEPLIKGICKEAIMEEREAIISKLNKEQMYIDR